MEFQTGRAPNPGGRTPREPTTLSGPGTERRHSRLLDANGQLWHASPFLERRSHVDTAPSHTQGSNCYF